MFASIVPSGPHGMTRQPIYSCLLLTLIGTAIVQGTTGSLIGPVFLTLGLIVKIIRKSIYS
jgi:protein-S-isoprenylcysteine O-methyltransferase Ste14